MSHRGFAAVYPSPSDITREIRGIRRILRKSGVAPSERDDVVQDVVLAAWSAITEGRYRPDPDVPARRALRSWILSIAYYVSWHRQRRMRRRHEQLVGLDPHGAVQPTEDPEPRLNARREIAAMRRLSDYDRALLVAYGEGATMKEIAQTLRKSTMTAARHFYAARAELAELIGRELPPPVARTRFELPTALPWAVVMEVGTDPKDKTLARAVLQAFRKLPPDLADVLALAMVGATVREIAKLLGIPEGTAGSRLHRARRRLRALLARKLAL